MFVYEKRPKVAIRETKIEPRKRGNTVHIKLKQFNSEVLKILVPQILYQFLKFDRS